MQPTAYTNPHYVLPSLSAYFIVLVGDVRLIYTCYIPFRVVATRYCLFLITIQAFGHSYGLSNSLNNDFAHPRPLSLTTHTLVILPCLLSGTCLSLGLSSYGLSPPSSLSTLGYSQHSVDTCLGYGLSGSLSSSLCMAIAFSYAISYRSGFSRLSLKTITFISPYLANCPHLLFSANCLDLSSLPNFPLTEFAHNLPSFRQALSTRQLPS